MTASRSQTAVIREENGLVKTVTEARPTISGHVVNTDWIELAGTRIRLARPADPDALCHTSATERRFATDEYLPYWADLWPASMFLAGYLLNHSHDVRPRGTALEIGCGLGLVSVAAARAGWPVLATDYDNDAIQFTRHNAQLNDARRVRTAIMDWRRPALRCQFKLILGADVLYERRWHQPIVRLIARHLSRDGVALIAEPGREVAATFPEQARNAGLVADVVSIPKEPGKPDVNSGLIYRLRTMEGVIPS